MQKQLNQVRVAIIATDGFEESELTGPIQALQDQGAIVQIVSNKSGKIQGFQHHDKTIRVPVDSTFDEVTVNDFDAIMLPGGALNADALRIDPAAQNFVREFDRAGKPMAIICHAAWLLISSGLVSGRHLTSYPAIKDDVINAKGEWTDEQVVIDKNWVTSRSPKDLPAFNQAMIDLIGTHQNKAAA